MVFLIVWLVWGGFLWFFKVAFCLFVWEVFVCGGFVFGRGLFVMQFCGFVLFYIYIF